ncbi:S-adenosyl-L-methionine-dependent methyltransferase [Glarea lozoyensis ATCC 20868]|uniref:tRNA N(3)-methylcytidine methyltransferase n=1 Tax=Glarea lozoyensis (strain ATCC 20868 / MF5171) TaxID=1116229 RepID=S3D8F4_GLAL2|nr:S-adenosyl-L-methionine-dependent methyltransferase [Glarea lozoyensis ATCC 20868]EPE33429.1 S-adenosyl-L-methionine-dependent methyltransferase [Glarea lozoyensis ATCC 20868]
MDVSSSKQESVAIPDLSTLTLAAGEALVATDPAQTGETPPHLSHDPENNLKRSDPFQFGSRYLSEKDNVFEFNAWDHVETDDTYKEYAEQQYAKQREAPVSDFDKTRFNSDPAKWWNNFYKNNTANFFKDRKWLQQEFPILTEVIKPDAGKITLLEVGAGAGNTAFPILSHNQNPNLKIHACDFSKKAVEVIRENEAYDTKNIQADVWDAAGDDLPPGLEPGTVDFVLMIFIFSALSPSQWKQAVQNIYKLLKPGGEVLFRDYGRGDLAQVRFKKGRYLEENFYIRGDGTRVYFFEKDELIDIWTGETARTESVEERVPCFEVVDLGVDRRLLVNRKKELKMYRCWLQGRFRKHGEKPA